MQIMEEKMMKTTKILAMFLLVTMILTSLIACNNTGDPQNETQSGEAGNTTNSAGETTPNGDGSTVTLPSEVTEDQTEGDLNEAPIKILAWSDAEMQEFEYDPGQAGMSAINDAILQRNTAVEKRLNCKLEFLYEKGNNKNQEGYLKRAEAIAAGDENDFVDIFASYSMTTALVSTKGLCANLIPLQKDKGLNFEHPWWPQTMVKEAMFENSLYVCTGDISTNLLWMMETMYFNKDLYDILHGENTSGQMYDLVESGQWTMDKLYELSTDVYSDTDLDQKKSAGDTFGCVKETLRASSFFQTVGEAKLKVHSLPNLSTLL